MKIKVEVKRVKFITNNDKYIYMYIYLDSNLRSELNGMKTQFIYENIARLNYCKKYNKELDLKLCNIKRFQITTDLPYLYNMTAYGYYCNLCHNIINSISDMDDILFNPQVYPDGIVFTEELDYEIYNDLD